MGRVADQLSAESDYNIGAVFLARAVGGAIKYSMTATDPLTLDRVFQGALNNALYGAASKILESEGCASGGCVKGLLCPVAIEMMIDYLISSDHHPLDASLPAFLTGSLVSFFSALYPTARSYYLMRVELPVYAAWEQLNDDLNDDLCYLNGNPCDLNGDLCYFNDDPCGS